MTKNIYNEHGDVLLRKEEAEPECGKDFCDQCGDCLYCYGCDPCHSGSDDQHFWVKYGDPATR